MNFSLFLTRLDKLTQIIKSKPLLKTLVLTHIFAGTEHRHVIDTNLNTIMDIGANRGQFALAALRWATKARIISFEPQKEAASIFKNVFVGNSRVLFHQTAIGPQAGETTIHITSEDDSSSLLPISPLQERFFPGTQEIRTEVVKIGRLSDYVNPEQVVPPAMLKLDVQGYELEALRGCEDLLGRFSYVYVECSFVELYSGQALVDDVIAWLRDRAWTLSGIYNMAYDRDGRSIQADFLFEKSSRLHNE